MSFQLRSFMPVLSIQRSIMSHSKVSASQYRTLTHRSCCLRNESYDKQLVNLL